MKIFGVIFLFVLLFRRTRGQLCLVDLETGGVVEQCWNSNCDRIEDPRKIIKVSSNGSTCLLSKLKLRFSSYDLLLSFLDRQNREASPIELFFDSNSIEQNSISFEIRTIFPLNENYFLNKHFFDRLSTNEHRIERLDMKIARWYKSSLSTVQKFDRTSMNKFNELRLEFFCHQSNSTIVWIVRRTASDRLSSPCPSQIQVDDDRPTLKRKTLFLSFLLFSTLLVGAMFVFRLTKVST